MVTMSWDSHDRFFRDQRNNQTTEKSEHTQTTGPDSIPSFILKSAADQLAPILTDIFQTLIDTGEVPQDWRDANIVPLLARKLQNYNIYNIDSIEKNWQKSLVRINFHWPRATGPLLKSMTAICSI
jgi:hypothetical protein